MRTCLELAGKFIHTVPVQLLVFERLAENEISTKNLHGIFHPFLPVLLVGFVDINL